jgi:hypothetical protein
MSVGLGDKVEANFEGLTAIQQLPALLAILVPSTKAPVLF